MVLIELDCAFSMSINLRLVQIAVKNRRSNKWFWRSFLIYILGAFASRDRADCVDACIATLLATRTPIGCSKRKPSVVVLVVMRAGDTFTPAAVVGLGDSFAAVVRHSESSNGERTGTVLTP
ncbi:MAG: hypothetical protein ACPIOQ_73460 [Promethearchaeia archaeon]